MSAVPESLSSSAAHDADSQETREWMDALSAVIEAEDAGEEAALLLLAWHRCHVFLGDLRISDLSEQSRDPDFNRKPLPHRLFLLRAPGG